MVFSLGEDIFISSNQLVSIQFDNQSSSKLIVKKCFVYPFTLGVVFHPLPPNLWYVFLLFIQELVSLLTPLLHKKREPPAYMAVCSSVDLVKQVIYLVPFYFVSVSSLESSAVLK